MLPGPGIMAGWLPAFSFCGGRSAFGTRYARRIQGSLRRGAGICARIVLNCMSFRMNMNSLRLLIVDDEEAARYGMRRALESFGCEIAEAGSAESAHALMRDSKFDLLLLDVNLPGLSGLDFLTQIQNDAENSDVEPPLVVIIL